MSEKNLPILVILPNEKDIKNNIGGGDTKFFGEFTPEIQTNIINKFENILEFYDDVFEENDKVPAVSKIIVKPEATAKSHKPNDLCRKCPIIGGGELDEMYIKINKKSIKETISLVKNPPSKKFKANVTAINDIRPIANDEKISKDIVKIASEGSFDEIKNMIKIKLFDFNDMFDNSQIFEYVQKKLIESGFSERYKIIKYGGEIRYIKIQVDSFEDVIRLSSINGIRSIDFFQKYSLPMTESIDNGLKEFLDKEYSDSDVIIGIIDGGICEDHPYLKSSIVDHKEYVSKEYRNPHHATFIASTIQYGNILNNINVTNHQKYKLLDIIAIPNGDVSYGPTDFITEDELMEIIEESMEEFSSEVKIWNLSLGIDNKICDESISDLATYIDYIQNKYKVQMFVSIGNTTLNSLRKWPKDDSIGESDRIISPADSVMAITVGSIAYHDSEQSMVKSNEPSPFSRRGPGANYIVKPDLVDYGGNLSKNRENSGLGMKGLDEYGNITEGIGTSYATPRVVQKFAAIYDGLNEKDLLLAKAMLIHSARMHTQELFKNKDLQYDYNYYGYGIPPIEAEDILQCSEDEVTLIFKQKIKQNSHLEMLDFPYPDSLIKDGKYYGEVYMTLVYYPVLDERYGKEYCRNELNASFGTYTHDGKTKYKGEIPLDKTWDECYMPSEINNGCKWNPIKTYHREFKKGIEVKDGWKLRVDMTSRNGIEVAEQEFVLIITIKSHNKSDIYTEVVNKFKNLGYIVNNLETKLQIRQRQ